MATDPRQEQIMQLAKVIRQMGMPNPNTRTTDIMEPPPGGYQQTFLERPSDMPDDLWNKYLARISATNQTVNLRPAGPLTSMTEEQWQQQLQPYGPGENGPGGLFLPPGVTRTDGMGQIKGTAIMGPPPGGYTPMQYVEANTVENERKWQRRNTPGYDSEGNPLNQNVNLRPSGPLTSTTEEQWQQQLQPYGRGVQGPATPPTWSNGQDPGWTPGTKPGQGGRPQGSSESRYLDFARQQKGWNPAWDDYLPQLLRKLQNPDVNPTEGYMIAIGHQPGVNTGGGRRVGIPQELWSQIAEFAKTIPGMSSREWQGPYKQPGGTPQNPYAGTQYGSGQLSSISQELPRIEDLPGWKDLVPAQQRLLKDAGAWDLDPAKLKRFFSRGGGNPWTGVSIGPNGEPTYDPNFQPYYPPAGIDEVHSQTLPRSQRTAFTQPTESGQSPSVLSDLARKNAIRRQVLAKLMGRPTGANSLMDLLGQQQPY